MISSLNLYTWVNWVDPSVAMSYRNTAGEGGGGAGGGAKVLLKTYLYYSLWVGDRRGPWFRGLVTLAVGPRSC